MRDLILSSGLSVLSLWLLLYVNEIRAGEISLWGKFVYVLILFWPSVCFWLFIWTATKWTPDEYRRRGIYALVAACAIGLSAGIALIALPRNAKPVLFSGITAMYVDSLVLALAMLTRLPKVKDLIMHGNILGGVAVGGAGSALVGFLLARSALSSRVSALGGGISLALDVWSLVTIFCAFLCLLSSGRSQVLMGIAALLGVALLVVLSHFEVFFSIWLEGTLFWPFVLLATLAVEALLLRLLLPHSRFPTPLPGG